ncbi:MAG: hypothetical protein LBJ23_10970 [Tannerella sp.]|nr:hypothetical protein [Tannerella sp.]
MNLEQKQQHTNHFGAMETGDHFKNGASPKSLTSRGNHLTGVTRKAIFLLMLTGTVMMFNSCRTHLPKTFVQATDGGSWTQIVLKDGQDYDRIFAEVLDIVSRRFEMEIISRESGYARTQWTYTWNNKSKYQYRTRITFKFSIDKKTLELKTDAEYGNGDRWIRGFDGELNRTIKQDIMAIVGRTTL